VFIHVAIALFALMAMATYVFDLGIVLVSRGQAQNAADAGALSGALARAFDDFADPPAAGGVADISGRSAALANNVWTLAPAVSMSWRCPTGVAGPCARAEVFRNAAYANSLPMIFAPILGIPSHGVQATATAVVTLANSTNCMRPFAIADRWIHAAGEIEEYDHWEVGPVELTPRDPYSPGTGWQTPGHIGAEEILQGGNDPEVTTGPIMAGMMMPVRLPASGGGFLSGGANYRNAIAACIRRPVTVGQYLPLEADAMITPTAEGIDDLINQDEDATFNTTTMRVENSCAPSCAPQSPRVIPIAVFDTDEFDYRRASGDWSGCPGGGKCIHVVKILGYFVSHMSGPDVVGNLMTIPGELVGGSAPPPGGAFLVNIHLVR
jgi:hypothetical protein